MCGIAYYRRYHPFDGERTVAVERRVMFPLAEARSRLAAPREHLATTGYTTLTQQDVQQALEMLDDDREESDSQRGRWAIFGSPRRYG